MNESIGLSSEPAVFARLLLRGTFIERDVGDVSRDSRSISRVFDENWMLLLFQSNVASSAHLTPSDLMRGRLPIENV